MGNGDDMPLHGNAPAAPSLPWRFTSSVTMGIITTIAKGFLYGLNNIEVTGLEGFLETLDRRKGIDGRQRGLITGKNLNYHICSRGMLIAINISI